MTSEKLTGREMKELLIERGVFSATASPANLIVKRPRTGEWAGCYVAEFGDMQHVCDSARSWRVRIEQALRGAQVMVVEDRTATWRVGNPIIHAMVVFRWSPAAERRPGKIAPRKHFIRRKVSAL